MSWQTPKEDWNGLHINGVYSGDYFSYTDANRITGNHNYLMTIFSNLNPTVTVNTTKSDNAYSSSSFIYATDVNALVANLKIMCNTLNIKTTYTALNKIPTFSANGRFLYFDELNTIEKTIRVLLDPLNMTYNGRRKLQFSLGAGMCL